MTRSSTPVLEETAQQPLKKDKMGSFTVVKRNGAIVPFRRERIVNALEAAFRDTKKVEKGVPLLEEVVRAIEETTDAVLEALCVLASKGASLTVEGIQDHVEIILMKQGH